MKRNRHIIIFIMFVICTLLYLGITLHKDPLNPKKPVTIKIWHYYNGQTNEAFNQLVSDFNGTVGLKEGIIVESESLGDVSRLVDAVYDSASSKMGTDPLPNIFGAYPDNAYRVNKIVPLVDLNSYFKPNELKEYRQDFVNGMLLGENEPEMILPVACSTESLFLNKTDWDVFAQATGAELSSLSTWEGIVEVSQSYYNWTDSLTSEPNDGKAFLGIDSPDNFMYMTAKQLGYELFKLNDKGDIYFDYPKEIAKRVWDIYYTAGIKGLFTKTGRFSSDDAKIGTVIAYIGSTAGAGYFPDKVTLSQSEVYTIDSLVLPYPCFDGGKLVAAQNGAGMSITKSDEAHEYASAVFLKWFTELEQNLEFTVATGYLPVKNDALNSETLLSTKTAMDTTKTKTIYQSISASADMLERYSFYSPYPFDGSYEIRQLLGKSMYEQYEKDIKVVKENSNQYDDFTGDENFDNWYSQLSNEVHILLKETPENREEQ